MMSRPRRKFRLPFRPIDSTKSVVLDGASRIKNVCRRIQPFNKRLKTAITPTLKRSSA